MRNLTGSILSILFVVVLVLAGCENRLPSWNSGKLVIIIPDATQGAEAEFERELAQLFAKQLNSTLEAVPLPQNMIFSALSTHQAHLAAAALRSELSIDSLHFGPSFQTVREMVVCNRYGAAPARLEDLVSKKIGVVSGSPAEIALREAQNRLPALQWLGRIRTSAQDLLTQVATGNLDCGAANELQIARARNYHPGLGTAIEVATPSRLAWGFARDVDPALTRQVQLFFERIQQDGTLRRLLDRFYGHIERLDTIDSATFVKRCSTVLPDYRQLFEEASMLTGMNWRLLAALAYQESQWNPLATSFTNVRGMMMLTEDTADQMKVQNRLDARESIIAGARYLSIIKDQLPERILEPDRTWLALAAYNQGMGHLEDARILTARAGNNPDSWADVKKWMPLLTEPEYYETVKHGYARGGEAVILVENIRNYHDMLKRLEPERIAETSQTTSFKLIESTKHLFR